MLQTKTQLKLTVVPLKMVFKLQLRKRNISLEDNFPLLTFLLPCKPNFTGFPSREMISLQVINSVVERSDWLQLRLQLWLMLWSGKDELYGYSGG